MRNKLFLTITLLGAAAINCFSAITVTQLKVVDELRAERGNFSTAEKIGFEITVLNTEASADRIKFSFAVKDPLGKTVFSQSGNSTPSNVGSSGASIRNIAVSKLFTTSGNYSLVGTASVGALSDLKTVTFRVTAPIITLSYPPNGAQNLTDKPLVFRWVATGAAKYKLYVGDDRAFYNPLFTGETSSLSFVYPANPANPTARLSSSQVYYWKVAGLDANGNIISEASQPYSFVLASEAAGSTTLDIGITDIAISRTVSPLPGHLPIEVKIENKGGRSSGQFIISLSVNGLPIEPSQRIDFLNPGQKQSCVFQYKILNFSDPLVCMAAIDIFDDDSKNNKFIKRLIIPQTVIAGKAKIHGKVSVKLSGQKLERAQILYSGPKRGSTVTGGDGTYMIDELPLGDYTVYARSRGYLESDKQDVKVEKEISYTGVDFELAVDMGADVAQKQPSNLEQFNLRDAWEKLKPKIRMDSVKELEGFMPYFANDRELMKAIVDDKAIIKNEKVK